MKRVLTTLCAAAVFALTGSSSAAIVDFTSTTDMPFLAVGNTGNTDDIHGSGYGAVSYAYGIGTYEVTAGQYTEFLNAVAADDTYGLYNERMADPAHIEGDDFPFGGANIQRSGSAGSYSYSVAAAWEDRPVNYVSWGDVARFSNWLTNGMPSGAQDASTTEEGAYSLNGGTTSSALKTAIDNRNSPIGSETFYYMPSEDEWYKAAFHKNDGATGNYYLYPTSSDTTPSYIADGSSFTDPDPGNVATYDGDGGVDGIGAPYFRSSDRRARKHAQSLWGLRYGGQYRRVDRGPRFRLVCHRPRRRVCLRRLGAGGHLSPHPQFDPRERRHRFSHRFDRTGWWWRRRCRSRTIGFAVAALGPRFAAQAPQAIKKVA